MTIPGLSILKPIQQLAEWGIKHQKELQQIVNKVWMFAWKSVATVEQVHIGKWLPLESVGLVLQNCTERRFGRFRRNRCRGVLLSWTDTARNLLSCDWV